MLMRWVGMAVEGEDLALDCLSRLAVPRLSLFARDKESDRPKLSFNVFLSLDLAPDALLPNSR